MTATELVQAYYAAFNVGDMPAFQPREDLRLGSRRDPEAHHQEEVTAGGAVWHCRHIHFPLSVP